MQSLEVHWYVHEGLANIDGSHAVYLIDGQYNTKLHGTITDDK